MNPEQRDRENWIVGAHTPKANAKGGERALLEREVSQWMLADKEKHFGRDLGAKPRELPFAQFLQWRPPALPPERPARPRTQEQDRATAHFIADQAQRCATMFRAVIFQAALDLEMKWGATKDDKRVSMMIFEPRSRVAIDLRERLADLALLEPGAIQSAYEAGRLSDLSHEAIGQQRYISRLLNAEPTAKQPDMLRRLGL